LQQPPILKKEKLAHANGSRDVGEPGLEISYALERADIAVKAPKDKKPIKAISG